MSPDEYCKQKAAQSGSSFYYSFMFLPPPRRRAITALYAFCREVDDAVDETSEPGIAHAKLAWWREQVHAVYAGAPQHPVGLALQNVVASFPLPEKHFQAVIDGMAMDLERNRYLDFTDLEAYCYRVAGVVGLMSAEIFGYTNPATRQYAQDLGIAFQLTNIVRDVGEDARRGRIYVPQSDLARHGVTAASVLQCQGGDAFRMLMANQVTRACDWYDRAFATLPPEDRAAQKPGLIMAAIYRALLDEIVRDNYDVLSHRIALTPLRKLWIAWKTARRP
jgi:15-cis-phytoene synthase